VRKTNPLKEFPGYDSLVFVRIEFVSPGHRNAHGSKCVQNPNAFSMLGKNFRQSFIAVRRFVQTSAAQLDIRFLQPSSHHLLRNLARTKYLTRFAICLASGLHASHDPASAIDGAVETMLRLVILDALKDDRCLDWHYAFVVVPCPSGRNTNANGTDPHSAPQSN